MSTLSRCVNCGETPVVVASDDDDYKFVLKHDDKHQCYPSFKLVSYQNSRKECVDDWNDFNVRR